MTALNRFTLVFRDASLEADYAAKSFPRTRTQGRVAIMLAIPLYLLYGVVDHWLLSPENQHQALVIRCTALLVPVMVFLVSFTPHFERCSRVLLALIGLAGGIGILCTLPLLPADHIAHYYPGLVLMVFFTYNLVGTRFVYAVLVDVFLLAGYNLVVAQLADPPLLVQASHNYFIICANLIGGAAGYLAEYQHRQLFLRERTLERERQEHLDRSLHDSLTGLANRELLHDRIGQMLAHAQRDGSRHAGYYIDLDGFKRLNDEAGHEVGDALLKEVANQIKGVTRGTDTVARLGGDEFFVLAFGIHSEDEASKHAAVLIKTIRLASLNIQDKIPVTASIGVCLIPYDGANVENILRRADHAMYTAKKAGKDRYAFA